MRIVYDHQVFSLQRYGGISRYYAEVAARLGERPGCDVSVLAPTYVNAYLDALPRRLVVGHRVREHRRGGRIRYAANDAATRVLLAARAPDIVHETYYAPRRLASHRSTVVLTVLDMIHERFAASVAAEDRTSRNKAAAVARADHIICISHSTRADLIEILGVAPERTSVVHLGHSLQAAPPPGPAPVDGAYVLYVGLRPGYKNFLPFAAALAASRAGREGVKLVAFGGGPFSDQERAALQAYGYGAERAVQRGGDDGELARLYVHAAALAYPSLYEGFGIPPLEAMALGCPVLCSDTSSIPEVVGDAAELFDPLDEASMAAAVDRVLLDAERARALRAAGHQRVAQFSWDRCAHETHAVYAALR